MDVIGYLRVSTDRQAEQGLGLEIQEAAVRTWAKANGHRVAGVERDEGQSGSNGLDSRLGLARALEALRDRSAGGLAIYRLDRLARDLVLQEQLLREIWRLDAEVFSTAGGEANLRNDPDDPSRKLVRQVLGAISEYEREMINLRLRAGRLRKAHNGGYAGGQPPYGYRATRGELVPVLDEQQAIALARRLQSEGASLRRIAATLEDLGYQRRSGKQRWHPGQVGRMLTLVPKSASKPLGG